MDKDEYLKLIQQIMEQQYSTEEEKEEPIWIPAEPEIKSKITKTLINNTVIDIIGLKKDQIINRIDTHNNFKIGNFLCKITSRGDNIFSVSFFEDRLKTTCGLPCKITHRMNFSKDNRFDKAPWLPLFGYGSSSAHKISKESLSEVLRWIQAVSKLQAFT